MEFLQQLPYSSIAGALEYQAQTKPEKTAILYPDLNKDSREYASLTYKQYNNVTNYLAEKISKHLPNSSSNELLTCGLLAIGGLEYLLSQYALLKLPNVIMFPISARNSQAAIEHLLKETKTVVLLTTSQYLPVIKTIQQEQKELQSLKILLLDSEDFQIEEILKNKDIEYSISTSVNTIEKKKDDELNKVVVILHSSGSTAHPKPIYLTNRYFLISYSFYLSLTKDFWKEDDVILTWGALFHLLAFTGTVRSIVIGCTYALPLCISFPPKPDELLHNIQVKNGITVLISVPTLLEQLVRELLSEKNVHIGLKPLQKLRFVTYAGAGCPDELCKTLVDNDVTLLSGYGATETGVVLFTNCNPYNKRWKFMQLADIRKPFVRIETPPDAQSPNEKILIHLPNDPYLAENISNTPDGCYVVGDILLEDPPNSGEYRILGRQDDTLVHITGEKTNPIPMEYTIRSSPLIKNVAIIGHNQFCTAALIQLNIEEASNYDFNEIEESVWKIVQEANKEAPSHSRLVRQLVKILPMNKTLFVTHKGNLMRQKINQEYSALISNIYDKFLNQQYQEKQQQQQQQNQTIGEKKQSKWTKATIEKYLEEKLKSSLGNIIDYSQSIFNFGINSLQIIELRNFICQDIYEIPKNFLYEYSSIDQIAEKLIEFIENGNVQNQEDDPYHYKLTEQIIEKYIHLTKTNEISKNNIRKNQMSERVFLLTGANGSLGCFILQNLLNQSQSIVKRVYCLLRGSNTKERLFESFQQRQLDISILTKSLEQQRLIILSSSMNLSEEHFGQSDHVYQELNNNITDIIHSAWKMNFNQTIKDFEYDSILGVYNLLKFSSLNNIQFHFISSISSAGSGLLNIIQEEPLPRKAEIALPQGYGQSKYASEHLCWAAMNFWNVPVNIYRVGQVSGDTQNGVWNTTEMAAMMIYAGAGQLHKMPNIGQDINWIPVDICSNAFVELALKSSFDISISPNERVYHLLNPHIITYEDYLNCLREAGLIFDTVSLKEFLDTILTTKDTTNPLIKLSSFFEQIFSKKDRSKLAKYETIKTVDKCQALQNCPQIDSHLIQLYLNYWKKCQLLKEQKTEQDCNNLLHVLEANNVSKSNDDAEPALMIDESQGDSDEESGSEEFEDPETDEIDDINKTMRINSRSKS
ncbi:unnamed protein product [Adineta steineri]|uniref:Uncharacterized protein n=1 Tax=Adineta steineri TaxID=433720 RepID=A0A814HQC5_9BILA|nr:unnamed protein product [Adineta steineri]CAF1013251.1 unnamed protein product [Adineta steineri]CAF1051864.1 unnamed protein product [Adineta steineri]